MNKNILIVDDEEFILENLEVLLADICDNVYTAMNGKEALQVIKEQEINCVISDVMMPVMTGITFIKELREQGNEIPVIFFTAYGDNAFLLETARYGAFDFITKPDFKDLHEIVSKGFEHSFKHMESGDISPNCVVSEYRKLLEGKE
jgi:two-component system response regulator YesN